MSESFSIFPSRISRAGSRSTDHVVLPFPTGESKDGVATSMTSGDGAERGTWTTTPLIGRLCEALKVQQISYCHWKSNWKIEEWLKGEGDLDLLVDRSDAQRFVNIIAGLGFKQAEPPPDRGVPGILNYYGYDADTGKFVHLHVHYQLVIGHDLTKNYHLPIERLYLEQSSHQGPISLPAPEFELILFVFRMVLKHSTVETALRRGFDRISYAEKAVESELEELERKANRSRVDVILPRITPEIDNAFFQACLQSLRSGTSLRRRTLVRKALQQLLAAYGRRTLNADSLVKSGRRVKRLLFDRMLRRQPRKQFVNGGLLIALVGGDGAGKTTALKGLDKWLAKKFSTQKFHVGKPPRAFITLATIVLLRLRGLLNRTSPVATESGTAFPGYLRLFRWVRAAKDRGRLYRKARRFATNGGISLCDRFPVERLKLMDGPNIARSVSHADRNPLIQRMMNVETDCYRSLSQPDLLFVLRVDPEVAVRRKTDENEHHVRQRSRELWEQDWEGSNACVIDAGLPPEEVLAQLKAVIWANL